MINPELAVYIWMFPCFIFFVLPFLCLPIVLLVNKSKALQASQIHNREPISPETFSAPTNDKREHPRKEIDGFAGQIFSDRNNYNVSVKNISKRGICFGCSPDDFDQNSENLGIVLTETDNKIQMPIKPLWIKKQGEKLNVGASIINTQEIWNDLTNNMEEKNIAHAAQ